MRGAILQIQNTNVHTPRPMRGAIPKAQNLRFATVSRRSTHRILRGGSSGKIKMCVSLQRRAIQDVKMHVSLQRRAQNCMKRAHGVGSRPRHRKIIVLPQFRTSDQHEVTKGLLGPRKKVAFHHSFGRPTSTKWREGCASTQRICISPAVSRVRRSLFALRVASAI